MMQSSREPIVLEKAPTGQVPPAIKMGINPVDSVRSNGRQTSYMRSFSSSFTTNPFEVFEERVVIAMVGLPARGKSYLSNSICSYLNFLGCPCRIFNAGELRRKEGLAGTGFNFFDAKNTEAKDMRERMAMDCLGSILQWIHRPNGKRCSVGILDATNTTVARRELVIERIREEALVDPCIKLVFVESVANDPELLEQNYRMKLENADYKDKDPEVALADFMDRVKQYEAVYETIDDSEGRDLRYFKMIDAGEKLVSRNMEGFVCRRIQRLLASIHLWPRTIWIALVGDTEHCAEERMGGDPRLTAAGREYTRALCHLIRERENIEESSRCCIGEAGVGKLVMYTGTLKRHLESVEMMCHSRDAVGTEGPSEKLSLKSILGTKIQVPDFQLLTLGALNDINAGNLGGLTHDERLEQYPVEMAARKADKLNYRFPGVGGESYQDLIQRLVEPIALLEQSKCNSVLICDRAVFRVVAGYFLGKPLEEIPRMSIEKDVLELRRNHSGFQATYLDVGVKN